MHRSQNGHLRLAGRAADCHPRPAERAGPIPSVVDPQCRVIGATGLRAIDASIMPTVGRAKVTVPALYVDRDRCVRR
jgi:hypothetical protein